MKKREGAYTPSETDVLLSSNYGDLKAFAFLWIDNFSVPHHVSTEDILHVVSLRFGSHGNTSFLLIASHCCPMAGLSHLTECNEKPRAVGLRACLFPLEEEDGR